MTQCSYKHFEMSSTVGKRGTRILFAPHSGFTVVHSPRQNA